MSGNSIFVVGHKNPDTDSICSAISYAWFKNRVTGTENYRPMRAGEISSETEYVLETFGQNAPEYLEDVRMQVKDISLRAPEIVDKQTSVKRAWETLHNNKKSTLVTVDGAGKLDGLITIGDIAKSIMDVHGDYELSISGTSYDNIVDTLQAEILSGDIKDRKATGKVVIATANPDLMEESIDPGDMVVLGDRYESQLCALEMQAGCLIICIGSEVSQNIINMAKEQGTIVLRTGYDTFITARLLYQSIPVEHFMIKDNILCFHTDSYIDDIKSTMVSVRHRAFPVIDANGRLSGMLNRQSLLEMDKKKVILVDHNEENQAIDGLGEAEIEEIVDHHKLGKVRTLNPAFFRNQPVGCTSTILYMMYRENGIEIPADIAGLMCSAIISDTLLYRSPTCTPADKVACEALAEIAGIDTEKHAKAMFTAASNFAARSDKEILYQDFKKFSTGDISYGVGQITSMDRDDLLSIVDRMKAYMDSTLKETGLDMIFFMLTDIIGESSIIICSGKDAYKKLQESGGYPQEAEDCLFMEGVVSRKKQMIPALIKALS